MNDIHATQNTIRHPKLLVKAARAGMGDFRPKWDLKRIGGIKIDQNASGLLHALKVREAELNAERVEKLVSYDVRKHILVLAAILLQSTAKNSKKLAA